MEIKMTARNPFDTGFRYRGTYLCGCTLRQKISIPRGLRNLFVVFTKTLKPEFKADSFTITEANLNKRSFGTTLKSRVKEYRANLTWETEAYLARQYKKGFRYVRFEYVS